MCVENGHGGAFSEKREWGFIVEDERTDLYLFGGMVPEEAGESPAVVDGRKRRPLV